MQRDTGPYQIPDENLTAQGRSAVQQIVGSYTRALHAEMDRRAGLDDRRGDPEYRYTRNDVLAAQEAVEQSLRPETAVPRPEAQHSALLAPILVTLGSVGSSVMPHFLHSPWQWVLFLVLVLVGLTGLALTWVGGTRAKRGSPSAVDRPRATSARLDG